MMQINLDDWDQLKAKVEFLKQPLSYHEDCKEIISIETHISWIFLTDHHAYKLKKPVRLSYLDFSDLESRRINCEKEITLNQYLAPEIYLDTIPFMQNKQGEFIPIGRDEEGVIVDWFVKMKRFPRKKTLDHEIIHQKIDHKIVQESARSLIRFYQQTVVPAILPESYLMRLQERIYDNEQNLSAPEYGLDQTLIKDLHNAQRDELHQLAACIKHRVLNGRIIECHGDLRPEHICLISNPIIIDRLEFNRALRVMDATEELAYLSLECEFLGNSNVGEVFLATYQEAFQDIPSPELLKFYKMLRACLRAKISAWHLDDPKIDDLEKWYEKAKAYLEFAANAQ